MLASDPCSSSYRMASLNTISVSLYPILINTLKKSVSIVICTKLPLEEFYSTTCFSLLDWGMLQDSCSGQ